MASSARRRIRSIVSVGMAAKVAQFPCALTPSVTGETIRSMRALWSAVLLGGVTVQCANPDEAPGQLVSELRDLDTEEASFVRLLNNYRASMGLPALTPTRLLNQVAYDHSLDMGTRRYFSHVNLEGLSPFDRMRRAGYPNANAENIAAGNASAAATFEQWRTSPGHNTNMLNRNSRAIGIGRAYVAGSPYRYYWTNVFGTVVDGSAVGGQGPAPAPPPPPPPSTVTPCASGFAGSGANGGSGARCLSSYRVNVEAGRTYVFSTCGRSTGDTWLVVSGACACSNDDFCDVGSECRCTATATGVATICASTYGTQSAAWNYAVTSTNGGR